MFRPIRRKKNEISEEDAKELLRTARRGVLAVNGDDGYPYAIPINFIYDEDNGKIIFHGSRVGHKVDALGNCDKVCFTVIGQENVKQESWAPFLRSVVVFGRCRMTEDHGSAMEKLKRLAMKYYPSKEAVEKEIAKDIKATQLYEITIEHLCGKQIQEI